MTDNIKVLNEFLPKAETERLGGIKIGDTLTINTDDVLNINKSALTNAYMSSEIIATKLPYLLTIDTTTKVVTLLAGSTIYYPDGLDTSNNKKFRKFTTTQDISIGGSSFDVTSNHDLFLYLSAAGTGIGYRPLAGMQSGTTEPAAGSGITYYNTDTNIITSHNSSDGIDYPGMSFPICRVNSTAGTGITSISQEYSGFGFIGNTIFYLPGTTVVCAGGRNRETGALLAIQTSIDNVMIRSNDIPLNRTSTFATGVNDDRVTNSGIGIAAEYKYDKYWNMFYIPAENNRYVRRALLGTITTDNTGKITAMTIRPTAVLADRNDMQQQIDTLSSTKLDASRIQYVSAVPANPQNGVIYLIAQ